MQHLNDIVMSRGQYEKLLHDVLTKGTQKHDRTNTGTLSLFGYQMRFNLAEGFPLITTKKVHFKSVVHELLWFISGNTNIKYLQDNNVRIWNEWADERGNLGKIYGHQWRFWENSEGYKIDQLANVINEIKTNPDSRRLIVSAWNVGDLPEMALPPCHAFFQLYVVNGKLSCQLYQRSADAFLGVPFNIASYALLTHMVAHVTGLQVSEFIHTLGDVHIYNNHIDQVKLQLSRNENKLPTISLNPKVSSLFDFKFQDITLIDYYPHPAISAKVAV